MSGSCVYLWLREISALAPKRDLGTCHEGDGSVLVRLAGRDLALEMMLLVVEVLQLQMQTINLLPGFQCRGLGLAR